MNFGQLSRAEPLFLIGLISDSDLPALTRYRDRTEWQLGRSHTPGFWWLRTPSSEESAMSILPCKERWESADGQTLRKPGYSVPERELPETLWQQLSEALGVSIKKRTIPGESPLPIGFSLVPSKVEFPAEALHCRWDQFSSWSESVLAQRIECLRFARNPNGTCLVWGHPLPGIDGEGLYLQERIWFPAGFSLPEFIPIGLLHSALGLCDREFAFIKTDGTIDLIGADAWITASRGAIHMNNEVG